MAKGDICKHIAEMTNDAKTMSDLHEMLHEIAYTVGGMVCHFEQEDRSQVIIGLTQALGMGLMMTSKGLGQHCDIEMIVGNKS